MCSEVYTTPTIIIKTVCMNTGMIHLCTKSDDDDKWCGKNPSVGRLLIRFPGSEALIGIKRFGGADFGKVGDICKLAEFSPCCIAAGFLSEKLYMKLLYEGININFEVVNDTIP